MKEALIKCVVVDDEPMALDLIEKYVENTTFLELVGKFSNGIEALNFIQSNDVDLAFLDIQMPDLSGIEVSKHIGDKTRVVFTTAFDQYAIEGYKVDAIDYLLKPFNYSEFLSAAEKALKWVKLIQKNNNQQDLLFIKSEYKKIGINLNEVLYFEGLKDYVKIHLTTEDKPILSLMSLKSLESELPDDKFMRVHRSFIVSLDKIDSIERNQIVIGKQRINISEQYREIFNEFINKNSI